MVPSHDSQELTLADREYILKRLQEVQSDLHAQLDALTQSLMTVEHGHELEKQIASFNEKVAILREATATATDEATRLRHLVAKLGCLEPDTDPAIPCPLESDRPQSLHRRSLHSADELEDISEVTSATIKALMPTIVETVRKTRSNFPIQFSTPQGWAVKLSAVGAVIVALVLLGWWILKHLSPAGH